MKIQIRKERTPNGRFFFPYEWDGEKWVRLIEALVNVGKDEVVSLSKCKDAVIALKFPQISVVSEYELDDDGELISPTEGQ